MKKTFLLFLMNSSKQKGKLPNKKTRQFTLMLSLLMMFSFLPLSSAAQETVLIGGLYYNITRVWDGNDYQYEATVTHGTSPYQDSWFDIPEYIDYQFMSVKVTAIGEEAFFDSNLGNVHIPNTVTSIGARAFDNTHLWELDIPNSVTTIEEGAFYGCRDLYRITLPENLTIIPKECFAYCKKLNEITIPQSVTEIGDDAFMYSGLKKITLPNSLTSIGYRAFAGCDLNSIVIPKSVTYLGCEQELPFPIDKLTSITVEEGNPVYDSRDNCNAIIKTETNELFMGCQNTIIPNTVTIIGDRAFEGCGFSSITIPNSVTRIGDRAFWGSGLSSIVIPNSVTSFGKGVFAGCSNLTSVSLSESLDCIETSTFSMCSGLLTIDIPSSITSIKERAFSHCSNLKSIFIPSSVTSIENGAFEWCSNIESIVVDAGNSVYDSPNECNGIINTTENSLIVGCKNTVIPNSVTSIGASAFQGCENLFSINIPNSVTSIGASAFDGCSNLSSITVPNSVTSIGGYAFYGCSSLGSFIVPDQMTTIKGWTFCECGIRKLTIGNSVNSIEADAFIRCGSLNDIYCYTDNVPQTDRNAFRNANFNATVHVKKELVDAFKKESPWYNFSNIVAIDDTTEETVTDISSMDNAIYIEPFSGSKGVGVNIAVRLKNANAVTSYGFELVLPEGISIATESDGSFNNAVTLSTRHHSSHVATTNKLSSNTYKIGVASISSKSITDNDGVVLTITAQIAEDMIVGDYIIKIQEPLLVATDGTKPTVAPTNTTITIDSNNYVRGDVDGDGVIDLADAVLVINHYVGKPVGTFNEKAADVDGDNVIDLADAVKIINYYVGKIPSLARKKIETEHIPQ